MDETLIDIEAGEELIEQSLDSAERIADEAEAAGLLEQEEEEEQQQAVAEQKDPRNAEKWGLKAYGKEINSMLTGGLKDTASSYLTFTERTADALSGDTSGKYVITQFALGDDEVDYGMWESTEPTNLRGRVIENMPMVESFVNQKEIMNSFIIDQPPIPQGNKISNIQPIIELTGQGETIDIVPRTENHGDIEQYEFFLEHDNLIEMINPYTEPTANFTMRRVDTSHLLPIL